MSYYPRSFTPCPFFNFNSFLFNWTVFVKKRKGKKKVLIAQEIVESRRYDEQDELCLKTLLDYLHSREIMESYYHLMKILNAILWNFFFETLTFMDGFLKKKNWIWYCFLIFLYNFRSILSIFNIPDYIFI